jgi:hypothetical protein
VSVHMDALGFRKAANVGPRRNRSIAPVSALVRPPARVISPRFIGRTKTLALIVRPRTKSLSFAFARRVSGMTVTKKSLLAPIALMLTTGSPPLNAQVILGKVTADAPRLPATISPGREGSELRCDLSASDRLVRGKVAVSLQLNAGDQPQALGVLTVGRRGRVRAATSRKPVA